MLFFCSWLDRVSLLVDAEHEGGAIKIATDVADGEPPSRAVALPPGVFAAEVAFEDDGRVEIDPLEHVVAALDALEAAGEEDIPVREFVTICDAEGELPDGTIVTCERERHEAGDHRATLPDGQAVEWPAAATG